MAGQNTDLFDSFFRRADLDQDGRISGPEAIPFFQASNLNKEVLAQIWTYADQNRTGFLGRAEFYNALKLVTVAQSKRELTPDIVKAALYGPASAKIPAPQINLAAIPAPQLNYVAGSPVITSGGAAPTASLNVGLRGPNVAANASMSGQIGHSQQNQVMKPPRPLPPSQGNPGGGTIAASSLPGSNVSTDWLGGKPGGIPAGVTSQDPNRGITHSTTQNGIGLVGPGSIHSAQPRPHATTGVTQSAAPKLQEMSNQVASWDSNASVVSGNGVASDVVFGEAFYATSSQPKQDSQALVPPSGPQPAVRSSAVGSLQSVSTQQPVGQHRQVQSTVKHNQQALAHSSFASTGFSVGAGNSASGQSQIPWPRMTQTDVQKYTKVFVEVDKDRDGKISGEQARNLFLSWRLPREVLKQVWDLSDQDNDSMLSLREFCIALYLMERYREGRPLPTVFPSNTVFDETSFPAVGQRAPALGNANLGSTPGFQQRRGMPAARPVDPASVRPSSQVPIPQSDEDTQPSKQKPRVPVIEKHLVDQLSKEEQESLNSKFQEATEADKKVEELEKEILESKEKIEFFRTKMQELILYKSRCDGRVNEISERVIADKREVESLAKKYEEKYKQSGDVASKLTLEEATFRDIQAKKMELYQKIVKMEQETSANDFQVHADRIQLDLEELVKSLNERCKSYGLRAKPTQLVELPFGWQPGLQGGAADWDEAWDKFEDEGFTFVKELTLEVQNVIAPSKPKFSSVRNKSSSTDEGVHAVSSPNLKNLPSSVKRVSEDESAGAQSEEGVQRSPTDSPAEKNVLGSPSRKYQDFELPKSIGADGSLFDNSPRAVETQSEHGGAESVLSGDKNFDEPSWGAFDTNYDTDSVWDFNPVSAKDTDHEKHSESSFFDSDNWGLNPIRTGPTHEDNTFQKKSTFVFDSVPSTPIYNSGNTPHIDNIFQKKSPFAFADSVPSTPMSSFGNTTHIDNIFQKKSPSTFADSVPSTPMSNFGNSPRRFSEGSEDHSFDSFSRFDSFSTRDGGLFPPRESLTRFDSIRSTRDSEYNYGGFPPPDSFSRFDSFRSTKDSEYNFGSFPPPESLTRFDSIRSTRESDYGHGFSSFDDTDPFGSSGPFKSSLESQTPRRDSDHWGAF